MPHQKILWNLIGLLILALPLSAKEPPAPATQPLTASETFPGARQATGTVYWDENGNGQRDPGEPGVPGVPVTALHKVVVTDPEGRYTFTSAAPFLTVSVSFPAGSWPTAGWYRRMTREEETGVDFPLRHDRQELPFAFVHLSDPHGSMAEVPGLIYDECQTLPLKPKFYILTGDLRMDYVTTAEVDRIRQDFGLMGKTLQDFPAPVFSVSGNHDVVNEKLANNTPEMSGHPFFGLRAWEKFVGPTYWSFTVADVHFMGLEWTDFVDGKWDPYSPAMRAWAEGELARLPAGTRTVGAAHVPKVPVRTLELVGHTHAEGPFMGQANVLMGGSCARKNSSTTKPITHVSDGRPVGYRLLVAEKDRIDTFYKALGEPHSMLILSPRRTFPGPAPEEWTVQAQVFDPEKVVKNIKVTVNGQEAEVTLIRRALWWEVAAKCPTPKLAEGYADLVIQADWPAGTFYLAEPYLLLTGRPADFTAPDGVKVQGEIPRQKEAARVLVNGMEVGQMEAGQTKFSVEVPTKVLKRLNLVSVEVGKSRLVPANCTLSRGDQIYANQVLPGGFGAKKPEGVYLDLGYPGPVVPWAIQKKP